MGYIVRMPKVGLEMKQGTLLEWTVAEGGEVSEGDQIAEIESEKSIAEVEAREDGVLRRTYIEVDDTVPPSTPIGILAAPDGDISDTESEAESELAEKAPEVVGMTADTSEATDGEPAEAAGGTGTPAAGGGSSPGGESGGPDVKASPRAQKRAEELGVDLTAVEGTGPQSAVTADDVEAAATAAGTETVEGRAAETGVRRVVPDERAAVRHARATATADGRAATGLVETTEAVRTAFEERVTMTDVLLVVASAALADEPVVNGTYAEGTHQVQATQHVALVVDADGDPTSDVIPNLQDRSVTDIVEARQDIGGSDGRDEMPTFTLANAADADSEGLLVNQPAVAALDVDPTGQRAMPGDDGVDLRPLVTASLTYDTRALDASDADRFLSALLSYAERASELVLSSYRGTESATHR
jgi:pyruvate dehydrogenase E2 component (dihydrolipoamide acetyltransferase)